ncbi:multiple inositol polyphosphate phosphatase 1 [Belonocnema kinseyi]|uniref:multiple inositol polyphosphate phosphatase 1 n=1 Tax=Belonocnema kinseyi TaxID=2817044 RepID=UPI00143D15F3|nr:multiple inositol polyphosphate phosphatase 1 [Belonocnema kinseyi]
MTWKLCPLFLFVLLQINLIYGLTNCLNDKNHYECKLSTMVPYRNIANYEDSPIIYPGCIEKKIWLFIRHGTRFPDKKYAIRMIEEFPELQKLILTNFDANKTTLEASQVAKLAKWKMHFEKDDSKNIAEEGENEMIDLAERFQSRFPQLLKKDYTNNTYKFKYTATQRAEYSAKNFVLGLFGKKKSLQVSYEVPEYRDPVLRFYKRCKRWRKKIEDDPDPKQQQTKFLESAIVENMLKEISNRVGLEVDFKKAYLMYITCAYETAFHGDSPWCDLFSIEDFEFRSSEEYSVVAYFTHSGAILKLLSLIGVAKDEIPLTHDSFLFHKANRVWRTSFIDAFASNVAFILYECESQGPSVLFMHQERIVNLPNCPENTPCPISVMKDMYPDNHEECKFDEMCYNLKREL